MSVEQRENDNGSLARSLVFHVGMVTSIVIWGVLSLFTVVLPYRWRYWFISRWCYWMAWWLRVSVGIDVRATQDAPLPDGGAIVMSKHQSTWETISLERWFHPQTWVLKRELLVIPLFGWALALLRPIAIDRSSGREAVRQVVAKGSGQLAEGRWLIMFPEGTRVPAGHKARYRLGGAVLACESGAPVIPVAHNAGEHWPRGAFRLRPGLVTMHIGEPIDPAAHTPESLIRAVETWIETKMPQVSEGDYPGLPYERKR